MISIAPYDKGTSDLVAALDVEESQREFIGDFAATLRSLSERMTGHVIFDEGRPAGFFVIDLDYASQHDFADRGSVGLRSFFIAGPFQGRGLAKQAIRQLGSYLKSQRIEAKTVFLTVNCRNTVAASLYAKWGFRDDGNLYLGGPWGPQHIMQMAVT